MYFIVSRSAGARLYLLFSLNGALIPILKMAFHLPRPCWIDPQIQALTSSGSYGMPSGHVASASIVWVVVSRALGKTWASCLAWILVLLVSISRVYLGVHFISDVCGAWIVAASLLWCFDRSEGKFLAWLHCLGFMWRMMAAALGSAAFLAIGCGVKSAIAGISDPLEWGTYSASGRSLDGLFRSVGDFFGAACGIIMTEYWAPFEVKGALGKRCAACGYALLGAWLIRELGRIVPLPSTDILRLAIDFSFGAVSSFWMLFIAPWLLLKIEVLHKGSTVIARQAPNYCNYQS